MTKQSKKSGGKAVSLTDFLKTQPTSSSTSSWADEMDDEPKISQTEDLRELLNKEQPSSRPYASSTSMSSQFEHGAEERSSQWGRGDRGSFQRVSRPMEDKPLPTEGPYIAFIGNLPFETTKNELADFFEERQAMVEDIQLPIDRERENRIKGYGYLFLDSLESLQNALKVAGQNFLGRNIKVDVTDEQTVARLTSRREQRSERGEYRERREREPREQTVADLADNWRGGGGPEASDIFGRNKRRQPREDRQSYNDDEPRRPKRDEIPFEEKFRMQKQKREHRAPQRSTQNDLFGEGKPWEETDELRNRVEKLSIEQKHQVKSGSEEGKPVASVEDKFERVEKSSDNKKRIDFSNFTTKKDRSDRGGSSRGGSSSRGGRGGYNRQQQQQQSDKKPSQQQEDKPVEKKKKVENAWSALESVNDE